MKALTSSETRQMHWVVTAVVAAWAGAVVIGATTGFFASLHMPWIAAIVALSIAIPTAIYFGSPRFQAYAASVGHRPILIFHTWRIPAALLFFWMGLNGQLPLAFWVLAGVGDFIAGSLALRLAFRPENEAEYRFFHLFGFADFVVAVGTGLIYTLLQDPRMAPVAVLPLALVPLFGVGISGVTHLIAFDMLRRGVGLKSAPQIADTVAA